MPVKSAKKAGDQHGARKKYNIFLYCVKYGSDYRPMQFHIWGEMIVGGLYNDTDHPPKNTMFARAGGSTPHRKTSESSILHLAEKVELYQVVLAAVQQS